tara:strand:- start:2025 stop:2369 length:345 start_codon:yes stop_codon:yes gene_type:complete
MEEQIEYSPHAENNYEHHADFIKRKERELKMIKKPTEDKVDNPSHYAKWSIQPISFIMRNGFEYWRGNIVKYATRAGFKTYDDMSVSESEIVDLQKVIRYAEMRINQLKGRVEL